MVKTTGEWCSGTRYVGPNLPSMNKYVRCPICNRRLKYKTLNIEPYLPKGEYVYYIPAHKAKK